MSQCSSFQNMEVNFVSRSDMMDSGTPWSLTISMIFGTFIILVMQQGDCNAPSTFQRLMTAVFRDYITHFVHVYLDDIFIYSLSIKEHKRHLEIVSDRDTKFTSIFWKESH